MEPFADRVSRYDLQLLLIPMAFVVAWLLSVLVGVSTTSALTVASLVGAATIADGLFRRPPRPTAALYSRHDSASATSNRGGEQVNDSQR